MVLAGDINKLASQETMDMDHSTVITDRTRDFVIMPLVAAV